MKKLLVVAMAILLVAGMAFANGTEEVASFPDPEKAITVIVPQGAGGGTDLQTRALCSAVEKITGQQIIVENVSGGSTGIGTNQVIESEPDGYTLLLYGTYVVCGTMTGYTAGYRGLDFVAGISMEPFIIAVQKDAPYNTFDEFIQYAKKHPGELTLGNAGATATTGVVAYGLNVACGNCFNVVDCNGGKELIPYVLGGHITAGIFSQSEVLANIDGMKPLVFLGKGHSVLPQFASLANLAEAGYGDLVVPEGCFRGVCAPKGTDPEALAWLADAFEKAYNSEEFQTYLTANGLLGQFTKLDEFKAYNSEIIDMMKPIIKATGKAVGEWK